MQLHPHPHPSPYWPCFHVCKKLRVTKENRAAGVLDNFSEGEKYAEHALRKFVRNKSPEIMPSINGFFSDPKWCPLVMFWYGLTLLFFCLLFHWWDRHEMHFSGLAMGLKHIERNLNKCNSIPHVPFDERAHLFICYSSIVFWKRWSFTFMHE